MVKKKKIYAFIDAQNLNLGVSRSIKFRSKEIYKGWKLDLRKFFVYLKEHYRVSKAYLFIGYLRENRSMYRRFKKFGYKLVYKPTIKDKNGKAKGNVDAELVLQASAIDFKNYNEAIIVSGDGDFLCLLKYLDKYNKLKTILIPNEYSYSSLLKNARKIRHKRAYISRLKNKLEFKKN
jgi:uncharacterized LabA/DUF88 family protein